MRNGVGTHLGYHVVKKAIDLGMEILLRVPHLSFVLQGEDTMNLKVKTPLVFSTCLHAYLPAYTHAATVAFVVATAVKVGIDAANAKADAHDARSDADVSA